MEGGRPAPSPPGVAAAAALSVRGFRRRPAEPASPQPQSAGDRTCSIRGIRDAPPEKSIQVMWLWAAGQVGFLSFSLRLAVMYSG